jgi:hypothetical protein
MRYSLLFKIVVIASSLAVIFYMTQRLQVPVAKVSTPDQCVSCHQDYKSLSKSHPVEVMGCASCHKGNKYATNPSDAHEGIILNPSRLEYAKDACGECHAEIINRVLLSPMETQKGIKDVLLEQWVEKSQGFKDKHYAKELAESHFNKACASCHVNQKEEVFHDQSLAKGGGCADCHRESETKNEFHTQFTTRIQTDTCLKCHNRSNRIGISYIGQFESEGYGTPYKHGELSNKLDSHRFYYELPADIHHEKAGLDCIDCHSEKGVMGDGREHDHMEYAVDIACKDCHTPDFREYSLYDKAQTLIDLNGKVPAPKEIAYTHKKNSPLYNLQKNDDNITFYRKRDGKAFDLTLMSDAPYHTLDIHKRLDCTACHAQWIASCYGCHEVYLENGKQFDWVKHKVTNGQWQELRSFLRFESPSLGVGYNEKIMPFAPGCQVIGTVFKDKKIEQFHAFAMAGWDPHTTGKSRECLDCHIDPASLGLGRGILKIKKDGINFLPFYQSKESGMPIEYPIDAFVSPEGKQFQTTSREHARSFNKNEIEKIVNAYKCILCHRSYDDLIYKDFEKSKSLFNLGQTPCSK